MAYKTLLVERNGQITTITLNRPQAKNARLIFPASGLAISPNRPFSRR